MNERLTSHTSGEQTLALLGPGAGLGHNNPPPDALVTRVYELIAAGNKWVTTPIADQDNADSLSTYVDQLRAAEKDVEKRRKDEKQPHMDAAAAVDAEWNPLKALLVKAKDAVNPRLTAWLQHLETEKQKKLDAERAEAKRLQDEALAAAAKAAAEAEKAGDVIGASVAAETAARAAAEAEKAVSKLEAAPTNFKSSLGARTKSLRTYWHARVTSHMQALAHYKQHPRVIELIQQLAEADAKEGAEIPGCEVWSEQKAA